MRTLLTVALTSHLLADMPAVGIKVWRLLAPEIGDGCEAEELREFAVNALSPADASAVVARLDALDSFAEALEKLESTGIQAVSSFDENYPARLTERLGTKAPPLLFAGGNLELLQKACIGVVGSRDVDDAGTEFAEAIAEQSVTLDFGIVSGGARGVDSLAMLAAVRAGGSTVAYMADSLARGMKSPALAEALDEGRACLASPFAPSAGFNVANAMSRNKLIYAHAKATVVVASAKGEGGTWAGAVEALSMNLGPVLVREGDDVPEGNHALIAKGATAIGSASELEACLADDQPSGLQPSLGF
ncbi:MAG: DNA-processing protein DprA [Fimbriimonadaceae bacterium]|nr:DNA-processing protein DprA [Fimbriimonadaceae bacterium]